MIEWRISDDTPVSDSGSLVYGGTVYHDMDYKVGRHSGKSVFKVSIV